MGTLPWRLTPVSQFGNIPNLPFQAETNGHHFEPYSVDIFLTENVCILIQIWLKFVPTCPVNNVSPLHLVVVWCWTGDKPLPETMMSQFIVRRAGLLWSQQDFEWRWSVPLFKCLTVLEFSFILFDLCLLITFFNFIMNYVPIVTFWIFTYHKIWILSIMFCSIWSYWIIYFLACLEVSWRVVS